MLGLHGKAARRKGDKSDETLQAYRLVPAVTNLRFHKSVLWSTGQRASQPAPALKGWAI